MKEKGEKHATQYKSYQRTPHQQFQFQSLLSIRHLWKQQHNQGDISSPSKVLFILNKLFLIRPKFQKFTIKNIPSQKEYIFNQPLQCCQYYNSESMQLKDLIEFHINYHQKFSSNSSTKV
ncbi:unnamed protein product [Paramecium pentaurelia]|uniref:Uncharacterized protein n=1 Tax=Paramecium pentaurelia TaxID=43138 RepID=A0A8S1TS20_9CILI|nr:unnamed protein product [Paramecium pentaurelia]